MCVPEAWERQVSDHGIACDDQDIGCTTPQTGLEAARSASHWALGINSILPIYSIGICHMADVEVSLGEGSAAFPMD
jgi:hypothetical protein